jgi:hypothetical protein
MPHNLKGCIYSGLFAISLIAMAGKQSPKMKLTTMLDEPFPFRLMEKANYKFRTTDVA